MKYPMAHKIIIPKPYISREATDVAKTIAKERKRLAALEVAKPMRAKVVSIKGEPK